MELLQERRKYFESNFQFMRARSWLALGIAGFVLFFFLMPFVPMVVPSCLLSDGGIGYGSGSAYFLSFGATYVHSQIRRLTPRLANCI